MSVSSEGSTVPGLTTPHLKGEEPAEDKGEAIPESASVFEIALEFQNKLKQVLDLVDQHDKDINGRIDKLVKRISALEE